MTYPWEVFALGFVAGMMFMNLLCGALLKEQLGELLDAYRDALDTQDTLNDLLRSLAKEGE